MKSWQSRILLAVAILSACASLVAAPPSSPRAIISEIYRHQDAVNLQFSDRNHYFSKRIVELWAKLDADTPPGELVIDFDLASNSQGMEVVSYKVKAVHADAKHVTLLVTLIPRPDYIHNPADNVVRYDFIREGGRWVIDDMSATVDGSRWTLRGLLGDAKR